MLQEKYEELSRLPYDAMKGSLYAKKVITDKEKMEIDELSKNAKMPKLLDIIIDSLKDEITEKYKGFLEAMEKNEDVVLKKKAKKLGNYCSYVV